MNAGTFKFGHTNVSPQFPEKAHHWPTTGIRRVSINSFGYGGANSHIVIDDAYSYLRMRSLSGKHCTTPYSHMTSAGNELTRDSSEESETNQEKTAYKLLVWSSADKHGTGRMTNLLQDWYESRDTAKARKREGFLEDLTYTLDSHRSHLKWRSFALVKSPVELADVHSRISSPVRVRPQAPRLAFVFSGQGSQWFAMGRELMFYPSYSGDIDDAENYLKGLGCKWSLKGKQFRSILHPAINTNFNVRKVN